MGPPAASFLLKNLISHHKSKGKIGLFGSHCRYNLYDFRYPSLDLNQKEWDMNLMFIIKFIPPHNAYVIGLLQGVPDLVGVGAACSPYGLCNDMCHIVAGQRILSRVFFCLFSIGVYKSCVSASFMNVPVASEPTAVSTLFRPSWRYCLTSMEPS
jgi:hypothetical protein